MKSRHLMFSALTLLLCGLGPARAGPITFNYTGTVESYTVPTTGLYDITAAGAQGGPGVRTTGGLGAMLSGDISLTAGTVLQIVVGGQGGSGDFNALYAAAAAAALSSTSRAHLPSPSLSPAGAAAALGSI